MAYRSYNPYTQELINEYSYLGDDELKSFLEKSYQAFSEWKNSSLETRTKVLLKLAEIFEDEAEEHAEILTMEMGKPIKQAVAEVRKSATACRYYVREAERILSPKYIETPSSMSRVVYQAQGTVFAIMPWNYPYWQVIRCFAPASVSGNSVILKHASNVPGSALKFEDAVLRAGFPEDLFHNLFLTHKQTADVIASRHVRSISLTGSNLAGEIIAARAGAATKSCVMELGGSDPFIVFRDADINKAAEAAITGRFQNNGQSCIATKRLFLQDEIYNDFMTIFKGLVQKLKVGDPMDPDTDIGPLVDINAVSEIRRQLVESIKMGARLTIGSIDSKRGDGFFDPAVVEDVPDNCPLAVEEVFGPVIPVFRFSDYDDMIQKVNSSIFGLGSSVWSEDKELIERLVMDIDAGMVAVNGFTRSDPMLPFGGVKSSGYGRELSDNGMLEFLNIKTISVFD